VLDMQDMGWHCTGSDLSTWLNERRWAIMEVVLMLQASTAICMRRSRREAQWSLLFKHISPDFQVVEGCCRPHSAKNVRMHVRSSRRR